LPHADLIQEGNIGLMKAVKALRSGPRRRLVSFALHWNQARCTIHPAQLAPGQACDHKRNASCFSTLRSNKQSAGTMSREQIDGVRAN